MKKKKPLEWIRLDNAAKIFPSNTNEKDTKVFRISSQMKQDIDAKLLQEALDKTIELFPIYKFSLRKGVFWYYFQELELRPLIEEESKPPCSSIYIPNRKNHLFRITYYKKRINLEIYHALTDGTGALLFLNTILFYYLTKRHEDELKEKMPKLDYAITNSQMIGDSFLKYYTGPAKNYSIRMPKAYKIQGRRFLDNRINIIEGILSVEEVIGEARRYNTTLTIYITALFIYSIYLDMPARQRKNPIVLSVPVNLRSFFTSVTARNFFATINVKYDFRKGNHSLEDVIEAVKKTFKEELVEDKLKEHLNRLASLEKNAFMRLIPLSIKDIVLRAASGINGRGLTAAITNIGKISITDGLADYVDSFSIYTSVRRPQLCICSYGDKLSISFISPYNNSEIQKTFFRALSKKELQVTIRANE